MLGLALALLVLAIARPQLGYFWEESSQETTDVLIALDTSKSMLAPDLKPNRLARAKLEVEDFVGKLEGVRLGLIPFAGDAFLWCPLTYDTEAFLDTLKAVDTAIIPTGGTNLLSAIETAETSFRGEKSGSKIMILITDGENLQGQIDEKLPEFAKRGWVVHTIGIGTEEGELIPITKPDGSSTFVTDKDGNVVKSKLDADTLKKIADQTGGTYHALGSTGQGLYDLFENVIRKQLEAREDSRLRKIPIERYGWVVCIIILLLVVELLLKDKKSGVAPKAMFSVIMMATLTLFSANPQARASVIRDAQDAYAQGDFETAEKLYQSVTEKQPDNLETQYNYGVSALQNGNFTAAKQAMDVTLNTTDLVLQQPAYYNRGNTHYFLGRQVLDSNPQETVKYWEQSIKDFENALALDPADTDAANNKTEVETLLEQLKKLLENQNNDQNQDQNQDQNNENNDQQKNQDQQNQNSDQNQDNQQQDSQNQDQQPSDSQQDQQNQQDQQQQQSDPQDQQKDSQQQDQQQEEEQQQDQKEEQQQDQQPQSDPSDQKEEQQEQSQPQPEPKQQQQQPQQGQAGANDSDPQQQAEQMEALRLLESLKNEDGDGKELLFQLQNPEAEPETTEQDW